MANSSAVLSPASAAVFRTCNCAVPNASTEADCMALISAEFSPLSPAMLSAGTWVGPSAWNCGRVSTATWAEVSACT